MKKAGFSFVEMLIGIAIVAIILSLAVPEFRNYLANSKLRQIAEEYSAGLNKAKSEALRLNTAVRFVPNSTGWDIVNVATNATLIFRTPESAEADIDVVASAANIVFSPRGRVNVSDFTINFTSPSRGNCAASGGSIRCLTIMVNEGGGVKLCDPALSAGTPGSC